MNGQLSITVCSLATVTGSDEDPCDLSTDPYPVDRFSTCSDPDPCLKRQIPDPKLKGKNNRDPGYSSLVTRLYLLLPERERVLRRRFCGRVCRSTTSSFLKILFYILLELKYSIYSLLNQFIIACKSLFYHSAVLYYHLFICIFVNKTKTRSTMLVSW